MTLFRQPAVNTGQEFIKKSLSVVILARDRILAQSYYPPWDFPSPWVKGDVKAEISLDVLMCLRVLSEDRGLAVHMGSLGC